MTMKSESVSRSVVSDSLRPQDPRDGSPPGSSVHGVLQARILEWVAIPHTTTQRVLPQASSVLLVRTISCLCVHKQILDVCLLWVLFHFVMFYSYLSTFIFAFLNDTSQKTRTVRLCLIKKWIFSRWMKPNQKKNESNTCAYSDVTQIYKKKYCLKLISFSNAWNKTMGLKGSFGCLTIIFKGHESWPQGNHSNSAYTGQVILYHN